MLSKIAAHIKRIFKELKVLALEQAMEFVVWANDFC